MATVYFEADPLHRTQVADDVAAASFFRDTGLQASPSSTADARQLGATIKGGFPVENRGGDSLVVRSRTGSTEIRVSWLTERDWAFTFRGHIRLCLVRWSAFRI